MDLVVIGIKVLSLRMQPSAMNLCEYLLITQTLRMQNGVLRVQIIRIIHM